MNANGNSVCQDCNGAGYFRLDVPPGDPQFGKIVKCQNPIHAMQDAERWIKFSQLSPEQLETRLNTIDIFPTRPLEKSDIYYKQLLEQGITSNEIEDGIKSGELVIENKRSIMAARHFINCHSPNSSFNKLPPPFKKPRGWFYVWGTNGNAKSVIILALYNELRVRHGMAGIFITLPRLLGIIGEAEAERYERENTKPGEFSSRGKEGAINTLANVSVLAIDEFDLSDNKVRITPKSMEWIQDLLNRRYENAINGTQVTLFASNSDPSRFPMLVYDRIRDGRFWLTRNTAPSKRPKMLWAEDKTE